MNTIQELEKRNIDDWPYPLVDNLYNDKKYSTWVEIDYDYWDYALNVLPPKIWIGDAFMIGEPWDCTPEGINIYTAVVKVNDRYFVKHSPINKFNPHVYRFQIERQYNI